MRDVEVTHIVVHGVRERRVVVEQMCDVCIAVLDVPIEQPH